MSNKSKHQQVVVLGASAKPDRFAYKAITLLNRHGHTVIPVHPKLTDINGLKVVHALAEIKTSVDTLTLYVGPQRSQAIIADIIALNPSRVIFNPGTESALLEQALSNADIAFEYNCTLIMLETGSF